MGVNNFVCLWSVGVPDEHCKYSVGEPGVEGIGFLPTHALTAKQAEEKTTADDPSQSSNRTSDPVHQLASLNTAMSSLLDACVS